MHNKFVRTVGVVMNAVRQYVLICGCSEASEALLIQMVRHIFKSVRNEEKRVTGA